MAEVDRHAARPRLRAQAAAARGSLLTHPAGVVGLALVLAVTVVAVFADSLTPSNPFYTTGPTLGPPSLAHPMGTDNLGRDVLSGVVQGTRTSMTVVVSVTLVALFIGGLVGLVSGYRRGWLDDVLMRVTELFQVVPRFFLVLLVLTLFGPGLDKLVLVLGLTSWALLARVTRAETLSMRERDFVEAARAYGASNSRIVFGHVLPNVLPSAVVVTSLLASRVIMLEASVSFLGLGDPSHMSWGLMAVNAQGYLERAWWMWVFPGGAIFLAVVGLNFLGDALNDVFNPTELTPTVARRARARRRWASSRPADVEGRDSASPEEGVLPTVADPDLARVTAEGGVLVPLASDASGEGAVIRGSRQR